MSWQNVLKSVKGRTKIQDKEIELEQFRHIPEILDKIIKDTENAKIYLRDINQFPRAKYKLRYWLRPIRHYDKQGETEEVKLKAEELKKSVIKWIPALESEIEYMKKRRNYLDSPKGRADRNYKQRMKNRERAHNKRWREE